MRILECQNQSVHRHAFTIVELLVSIGIIGLLIAILLPFLSGVREQTIEQVCLVHIRSSSVAITQYSMDYRGYVPFGGREMHEIESPYGETVSVGGVYGLAEGRWSLLMADYWGGDIWTAGMMCPKQPIYDPDSPQWPNVSMMSDGFCVSHGIG